jgi:hypothetical protein
VVRLNSSLPSTPKYVAGSQASLSGRGFVEFSDIVSANTTTFSGSFGVTNYFSGTVPGFSSVAPVFYGSDTAFDDTVWAVNNTAGFEYYSDPPGTWAYVPTQVPEADTTQLLLAGGCAMAVFLHRMRAV